MNWLVSSRVTPRDKDRTRGRREASRLYGFVQTLIIRVPRLPMKQSNYILSNFNYAMTRWRTQALLLTPNREVNRE